MEIEISNNISEVEFSFKEIGWKKYLDLFSLVVLLITLYPLIVKKLANK